MLGVFRYLFHAARTISGRVSCDLVVMTIAMPNSGWRQRVRPYAGYKGLWRPGGYVVLSVI